MSLPETCPFCGAGGELKNPEKWVGFTCMTTIHAGQDERRMQSLTCAGLERKRLDARLAALEAENKTLRDRVAELEAEAKQAREDEAWFASKHEATVYRMVGGWLVECDGGRVEACTIQDGIRALRALIEGGPR